METASPVMAHDIDSLADCSISRQPGAKKSVLMPGPYICTRLIMSYHTPEHTASPYGRDKHRWSRMLLITTTSTVAKALPTLITTRSCTCAHNTRFMISMDQVCQGNVRTANSQKPGAWHMRRSGTAWLTHRRDNSGYGSGSVLVLQRCFLGVVLDTRP